MKAVIKDVQEGMKSIRQASLANKVPRRTLAARLCGKHGERVGRPPVLSSSETIQQIADGGYPLSVIDVRILVKTYLDKSNREVSRFEKNTPGTEWIAGLPGGLKT